MTAISSVGNATADLGEGPYWDAACSILLWVDIPAGLLHRTDPETGDTETIDVGAPLSAAFPAEDGRILLARKHELILREKDDSRRVAARVPETEGVRLNDGSVDPRGRLWIGTMHIGETDAIGELYRQDPDGSLRSRVTEVTVSNGIGWSPNGQLMYYVDSPTRRIDVFAYDPGTGELADRRLFADLSKSGGFPDGLTVDIDGYVWVAVFGAGALHRYAPSGQLDAVIELPASHPTSCAFGGEELRDLFVTTASERLSDAERTAQPFAGRLLRLRPGVTGQHAASARVIVP